MSKRSRPSTRAGNETINNVVVKAVTDDDVVKVITGTNLITDVPKKFQKEVIGKIPELTRSRGRPKKKLKEDELSEEDSDNESKCSKPLDVPKNFQKEATGKTSNSTRPRGRPRKKLKEDELSEKDSDNESKCSDTCEKPSGLCDEDDLDGSEMCSFRTPKKRQGMLYKAEESASKTRIGTGTPQRKPGTPSHKTPIRALTPGLRLTPRQSPYVCNRTPSSKQTPKKSTGTPRRIQKKTEVVVPKTPYQLRARQKKAIQAYTRQMGDFDDGDSDFHDSDCSSSSESEGTESESDKEDSDSDSGKGSEEALPSCRRSLRFLPPSATPSAKKRGKEFNYVFTAEEYFQSQSGKCVTSDHSLSRLKNSHSAAPGLPTLGPAHQRALATRRTDDTHMFQRWMFVLSQGFSILAYGLGSKYKILQRFHREMLPDSHVVVVNGFFPNINIKEIVETIARDLLGLTQVLPSVHATVDWIEDRRWMPRVFLLVNNLDAEMLRCDKTQRVLSRLASLPRVHLVASVDHINCPLLWDQAKLSGYNFMWEDVTTLLPYMEETSYETSLMAQNSGTLALSSLLSVYRSLPHNSRGVFRIILEKHLDANSQKYSGMAFSELYGRCREEMLVTSDLALRTMLTEFLDHQMVKWRRDELLFIPTDLGVLRQFHVQIQDS